MEITPENLLKYIVIGLIIIIAVTIGLPLLIGFGISIVLVILFYYLKPKVIKFVNEGKKSKIIEAIENYETIDSVDIVFDSFDCHWKNGF